jgi:hypothetical protein
VVSAHTRRDLKPRLDADVLTADAIRPTEAEKHDMGLISVLIGVLVIVVVGAICFWAIDKFANDRRLANLLSCWWCSYV